MDEAYENLANAVILLAVKDYRQAMRSRNSAVQASSFVPLGSGH